MAVSVLCAPVVYPWYLLYFTPFLWSRANLPLIVWTITSLPVYLVWERARHGGRWTVPWWIEVPEFAFLAIAAAAVLWAGARRTEPRVTDELV
jgi:alpha-1,6-mannosyltransferase